MVDQKEELNIVLDQELDFDLEELTDYNKEKIIEEKFKNSGLLCNILLYIAKKTIVENKNKFSSKEVSEFFHKDPNQIRNHLKFLKRWDIVYQTKKNGREYLFVLKRDNKHFDDYIKLAKEVLGIK